MFCLLYLNITKTFLPKLLNLVTALSALALTQNVKHRLIWVVFFAQFLYTALTILGRAKTLNTCKQKERVTVLKNILQKPASRHIHAAFTLDKSVLDHTTNQTEDRKKIRPINKAINYLIVNITQGAIMWH